MNSINNYITEKLKINKDSKSLIDSDILDAMKDYFIFCLSDDENIEKYKTFDQILKYVNDKKLSEIINGNEIYKKEWNIIKTSNPQLIENWIKEFMEL